MPSKKGKSKKSTQPTNTKAPTTSEQTNSTALKHALSPRSATGVLASLPRARDIHITNFSLSLLGTVLVEDTELHLNYGPKGRYGLIGLNGCGKSSLLKCIAEREIPIPDHINIYHVDREVPASDKTAMEAVIEDVEAERQRLEAEAESLALLEDEVSQETLNAVYESLDLLEPDTIQKRAGEILHGLGFTKEMQHKKCKEFSGGWRMRIALAKALFMRPVLLLLDDATNHLDLEATVWLEEYLKGFNHILLMVSHSQDFLNSVCTNIIHLRNRKLTYYTGNYDSYVKARSEREENQMKQYNWEQEQIAHMKAFIQRFGHGSRATQAESRKKALAKMEANGLTEKVVHDKTLALRFADPGHLPPPVIQFTRVWFGYSDKDADALYEDLDLGIDLDSRIAFVGLNGVGKSTLLKLMAGELTPTKGTIRRHPHCRIGWFHQHLTELLDLELSPLEYMMQCYGNEVEEEKMRQVIGRFGITGKMQKFPMKYLSDGQRSRVVFAWLAWKEPHILLLDEPTNGLDIETIDALAKAINEFEGGVVLVSHDFRLIKQVAKDILVCQNKTVTKWEGDIMSYKEHVREELEKKKNN